MILWHQVWTWLIITSPAVAILVASALWDLFGPKNETE